MTMLYHETQGTGSALVLVHGWGLHGGIFGELPVQLARDHRVTVLDLPGHGRSRSADGAFTLESLTDRIVEIVPESAIWLGWSLGASVALSAALRHPGRVAGLVLVGATPKFVQAPDWTAGMPAETFAQFAHGLASDYRGTLLRFLSLQAGNDEEGRATIRNLRGTVFAHGEPRPEALAAGLAILEHTDLRARLAEIGTPTLVVHGSHDRLSPPAAGEFLAARIPGARLVTLAGAGHAPFLSQPAAFLAALRGAAA